MVSSYFCCKCMATTCTGAWGILHTIFMANVVTILWASPVIPVEAKASAQAMEADMKWKALITLAPRWGQHQSYMFGSAHDSDHNGIVRASDYRPLLSTNFLCWADFSSFFRCSSENSTSRIFISSCTLIKCLLFMGHNFLYARSVTRSVIC